MGTYSKGPSGTCQKSQSVDFDSSELLLLAGEPSSPPTMQAPSCPDQLMYSVHPCVPCNASSARKSCAYQPDECQACSAMLVTAAHQFLTPFTFAWDAQTLTPSDTHCATAKVLVQVRVTQHRRVMRVAPLVMGHPWLAVPHYVHTISSFSSVTHNGCYLHALLITRVPACMHSDVVTVSSPPAAGAEGARRPAAPPWGWYSGCYWQQPS